MASLIPWLHLHRDIVPPVKEGLPVPGFLSGKELTPVFVSIDDPGSMTLPADHFDVVWMIILGMLLGPVHKAMVLVCSWSDATTFAEFIHLMPFSPSQIHRVRPPMPQYRPVH
jgi:hypothetical protein